MTFKEREAQYHAAQEERKAKIRSEPSRWKRFWKWAWYWLSFPFLWIWTECHDWRTLVVLVVVMLIYSSSVWGFYLAALIVWANESARAWLIGIGSAVWVWWLGPFSPFMELVIFTTMGAKAIMDRIRRKKDEGAKD